MLSRPLSSAERSRPSRWALLLFVLWSILAIRIGLAVVHEESLKDNLALPTVALFVTSALLASRVFSMFQRRAEASRPKEDSQARS